MINIIAHRGFWLSRHEQNTLVAFQRALDHGFGIETDFRDFFGNLVIAHDLPTNGFVPSSELGRLIEMYPSCYIAINIKSDGIGDLIANFLEQHKIRNYFNFDMSIPETRQYLSKKLITYARLSEYEAESLIFNKASGIWLDMFKGMWFDADLLRHLMTKYKNVAIVSPELHGRGYIQFWKYIKDNNFHLSDKIILCTDFPLKARNFFYDSD